MQDKFIAFQHAIESYEIPEIFNFPFYYEPSPIAKLAAFQLQDYLTHQQDWKHNFGFDPDDESLAIGKMFGVLVVKRPNGVIGFLAAFSGKLADSNHHQYFVPPVFDMLAEDGFFKQEEAVLNALNTKIEENELDNDFLDALDELKQLKMQANDEIFAGRDQVKQAQKRRKALRTEASKTLSSEEYETLMEGQREESLRLQYFQRVLEKEWLDKVAAKEKELEPRQELIARLKSERKERSQQLQDQLFDQYKFLNANQKWKSLKQIFKEELNLPIPAAAGECAAPKLLHYAFKHGLQPIALAEFWWGRPPKSEVRKHGEFYPACRSKCEPILGHMLQGLHVEENPMLKNPAEGKQLEIIYEDDALMVINKPAEFLSVPGKHISDSVQKRINALHPGAVLVHRLDQSTSGIILVAKTKVAHTQLQAQFIKRTVTKRYIALLNGIVSPKQGLIDLPLRVDLDNRPRQMVCYQYGKSAKTKFEVIEIINGQTRISFFPITGRTHQLRVHAAHPSGLGTPIVGDDLYGQKSNRLHLHAAYLEFTHPNSKERVSFQVESPF